MQHSTLLFNVILRVVKLLVAILVFHPLLQSKPLALHYHLWWSNLHTSPQCLRPLTLSPKLLNTC